MNLKPESLEALLLDQSLGALTAEAEELLAGYLETQPAARKRAKAYRATAHLAQTTLARGPRPPLPEPRFKKATASSASRYPDYLPWLAAAACLVLGFGLAKMDHVSTAGPIQASHAAVENSPQRPAPEAKGNSFWQTNNLAHASASRAPSSPYLMVWDSPLKKPRIKSTL